MSATLRITSGTHGRNTRDSKHGTPAEIHCRASAVASALPQDIPLELVVNVLYHSDLPFHSGMPTCKENAQILLSVLRLKASLF